MFLQIVRSTFIFFAQSRSFRQDGDPESSWLPTAATIPNGKRSFSPERMIPMSQSENGLSEDGGCSTNRSKALHTSENAVWLPFRAQAPGNGRSRFALVRHIPQMAVRRTGNVW